MCNKDNHTGNIALKWSATDISEPKWQIKLRWACSSLSPSVLPSGNGEYMPESYEEEIYRSVSRLAEGGGIFALQWNQCCRCFDSIHYMLCSWTNEYSSSKLKEPLKRSGDSLWAALKNSTVGSPLTEVYTTVMQSLEQNTWFHTTRSRGRALALVSALKLATRTPSKPASSFPSLS